MRRLGWLAAWVLLVSGGAFQAFGEVTRWEIRQRQPYAQGRELGPAGAYEQWEGKVYCALDPSHEANAAIVDLPLAPRNAQGKVEFSADFRMLVPVDLGKAHGGLFYEVNNRGGATALRLIDGGADDFLCRQGWVVLWSGWIAEVQPGSGRLRLEAPWARENGQPLRGPVRCELVVDRPVPKAALSHRGNQGSYRPSPRGLAQARVTRRLREADPREEIPRDQWKLHVQEITADGATGQLPLIELEVAGGLVPGWIYEVVYEAEGALVQGVGLAGIRDIVSALKYGRGAQNPLVAPDGRPWITRAIGFGTSQSGRALRMFLYDGFNADEQGRQVFDGAMPHVAGAGLGFFNHRFASPTRHNAQHDNHLYPADVFPFAYGEQEDPFTGRREGILSRARASHTVPKVMHTQSSSEYWHRAGSLVHTDPRGEADAELPPEVRIYTFGGTQHGPGSGVPGERAAGQLPPNPADYRPLLRALLVALDQWISGGTPPPPSRYPRFSEGTLVGWREAESGWQPLPGVRYPGVIHQPAFQDRGPEFLTRRRTTIEPPEQQGTYIVRVPALGPDNNELGCLLVPAVAVPLGTYTSWNLRHRSMGAEQELLSLAGGYIPLPRTAAQREATGDPRLSLEERYGSFDAYRRQFLEVAARMVEERYLLEEDLPRLAQSIEWARALFQP
ncbi:MAG: hypothetical protein K6T86_11640 [Pirellulales bacterium]|nr:hypothetical protein [Pirellulales bacterium]